MHDVDEMRLNSCLDCYYWPGQLAPSFLECFHDESKKALVYFDTRFMSAAATREASLYFFIQNVADKSPEFILVLYTTTRTTVSRYFVTAESFMCDSTSPFARWLSDCE